MKKSILLGLIFLLGAGATAFGQASLPASYAGPWSALPTGWTKQGTGTYSTDYDGGGEGSCKFQDSGNFVQVYFSGQPAEVSYFIQGNGLSGSFSYKVQESANGSTWTDVVEYNSGNKPSSAAQKTNALLATSRYVKFLYVTKDVGNVGLDGVSIEGPGSPSIVFDPAGTQSAPVSNLHSRTVTISPYGSGMTSWALNPSYSGPASLSGGAFEFTPASDDAYTVFTLSVMATNSIGGNTGTVDISVTAYQPPVPVIEFSPAAPYSLMATETQKLGIAVSPSGSGLTTWTLLPAYTGSASLSGTNFTFIPAEADGPGTYTFTVLATNSFGTSTGVASIVVAEYVPAPPPGSYICTFEDGSKTGYAAADVTLNGKLWNLAGILIGTSDSDKKIGGKAARLKYVAGETQAMTVQSPLLSSGIGIISLWYAPYGTHGDDAPTLAIEVSQSLTAGWIEVGQVEVGLVTELTYQSMDVYISEPVYVRIRAVTVENSRSANFDNITITPYTSQASTPYDAFLLEYNVTPGDPGTELGDDLDDDTYDNQAEFIADTNPYDAAIHP
jgi:hypothetical protein